MNTVTETPTFDAPQSGERRQEYLRDKALVFTIATLQNTDRPPHGDLMSMCEMVLANVRAEYLALIVGQVAIVTGHIADPFAYLEMMSPAQMDYQERYNAELNRHIGVPSYGPETTVH